MALADPIAAVPVAIAGSGLDIWLALDGLRSIDEIRDDLAAEYAQPPVQIEREIDDFLEQLRTRGLVARIDESADGIVEPDSGVRLPIVTAATSLPHRAGTRNSAD